MQVGDSVAAALAAAQAQTAQVAKQDSGKKFVIPGWQEEAAQSPAAQATAASSACGVDAVIEEAARSRVNNAADEVAYLQQLESEDTARAAAVQQKKDELLERLNAILASSPESYVQVDEAVFEKILDSEEFADKIGKLLKTIEEHPWFTEDIPGLVSRFVYIGPDGECMVGIVREVSADEEEEKQIEVMLQSFLKDSEGEMERVLYTFKNEDEEVTSLQLAQQAIEMFIARRQAMLEGLADAEAEDEAEPGTAAEPPVEAVAGAGQAQAAEQPQAQAPAAELPPLVAV